MSAIDLELDGLKGGDLMSEKNKITKFCDNCHAKVNFFGCDSADNTCPFCKIGKLKEK
jgi:hypothetical protein